MGREALGPHQGGDLGQQHGAKPKHGQDQACDQNEPASWLHERAYLGMDGPGKKCQGRWNLDVSLQSLQMLMLSRWLDS